MQIFNTFIFIIMIVLSAWMFKLHLDDINLNDPTKYIEKIDNSHFSISEVKEVSNIEIKYSKKRENSIIRFGVFIFGVVLLMLGINLLIYDKEKEEKINRIELNEQKLEISNKGLLVIGVGILLILASLFSYVITEYFLNNETNISEQLLDIKRRIG